MLPMANNFSWMDPAEEIEDSPSLSQAMLAAGENAAGASSSGDFQHLFDDSDFSFSQTLPNQETFPCVLNSSDFNFMPETENNPCEVSHGSGFFHGSGFADLGPIHQVGGPSFSSNPQFMPTHFLPFTENGNFGGGFDEGLGKSVFTSYYRGKFLKPLENAPSFGEQPTLFQKRAALRKNPDFNTGSGNLRVLPEIDPVPGGVNGTAGSSSLAYVSEDLSETVKVEEMAKNGGMDSNLGGGDPKGKKKKKPSKNLMAERRRRKKLNDRLFMLRSIVPKISKMDRASILGDAVDYLKDLMQKINSLQAELDSTPSSSSAPRANKSLTPLTPIPNLASQVKEEHCLSPLPSPNGQPARIEVRMKEENTMNIHMFCGKKPGLLMSTMKALENIGLDVQHAVISCFNGFTMDIYNAEQYKEGQDVNPEQVKALLVQSAGLGNAPASN